MRTVTLSFPSGRTADEVVVDDAAGLAWIVNLGCMELHPHPVRTGDLDHPDELRVDLDPQPGVAWEDVRTVSMEVKALLDELGLVAWPKTSGSRGMHINVRIRATVELQRGAQGRAGVGSRSGKALFAGEQQMVEGRAAWSLSGLQPEREGSNHLLCFFGEAAAGRAREYNAALG